MLLLLSGCLGPWADGVRAQAPASAGAAVAARRVVAPQGASTAGSYSPAIQVGGRLFVSGQLGRDPKSGELLAGAAAQTRQAMENVGVLLRAAGLDYGHLVTCHVYLASMDDYGAMNDTYRSFFSGRVPSRTTIEAAGLPRGAAVEITCIAFGDPGRISVVTTPPGSLPTPLGPYSAGVWAGDTLYLSGMGGQFPKDRRLPEPLGEQVTQALANIKTTLDTAGLRAADVVSSAVYLTAPDRTAEAATAYAPMFPATATSNAPPRSTIVVPRLPGAIKAEITCVAVRPGAGVRTVPAIGPGSGARGAVGDGVLYTRTEDAPEAGAAFEPQFRAAIGKLQDTVRAAGLQWSDVAHVNVYLADLADFAAMDTIFREMFPTAPPARTTIRVSEGGPARVQVAVQGAR
jgi:2-iminobutanoate/2-iminopropanoate deaminase